MISKINTNNGGFLSRIFEDKTSLSFQRYFYLSDEE